MADEMMLEIVTPEKMAFNGKVEEVTVPGSEGEFGVLRGHAPLLAGVDIGELHYTQENKRTYYAISTGYAEVTPVKVTILVETAERADLIDKERAQRAKDRAEERIAKMDKEDVEFEKVHTSLQRAITRISVADKK
jgi:F-type H+-transporting ATPase subunit epsilon